MEDGDIFMKRCIQLADLGRQFVSPNPRVGAVLVYQGRIIGEGYHQQYGGPHAEVHCLNSVAPENRELISQSTLYVSLEPCAHFGKTPPCADLIIRHQIPKVVVGSRDPFPDVNGKGIERLRNAGIEVITGIGEAACLALNQSFFTRHSANRPYLLLKWAQSADGYIALPDYQPTAISHPQTNRLTHQWRSETDAILIGTRTAASDNPSLTNRYWYGRSPLRMLVDLKGVLSPDLTIFSDAQKTVVFGRLPNPLQTSDQLSLVPITEKDQFIPALIEYCNTHNIQSVLIEGGPSLQQSFIDTGCWDEARIITNTKLNLEQGIPAPRLLNGRLFENHRLATDRIMYFRPSKAEFN